MNKLSLATVVAALLLLAACDMSDTATFITLDPDVVPSTTKEAVTEDNLGVDWHPILAEDGSIAFTTEHGAPDGFGPGALELATSSHSGSRAHLFSDQDQGDPLPEDISYSTFVDVSSTGSALHAPSINVAIFAAGDSDFATLVFEPIYTHGNDAIVRGGWQSWDASGEAKWWSTRAIPGVCAFDCFVSWDDIRTNNPDATIISYAMNLGTGNPDILAAVDAFTVGDKTFDFEPKQLTKEDCMDGGWQDDLHGHDFRNQGDCVSFYASGGKTRGPNN